MTANQASGCLPNPRQRLLLRAALCLGPEAVAAWEQWERDGGLDHLDDGSFRLLPLAGANLSERGYQGPHSNQLKGVRRQAWSQNQVLFGQVRPLLETLHAAGTPVLLMKGAALAFQVYPDAGCRPMRDIDILVPAAGARELWKKLEADGWRALYWRPRALSPSFFAFRHAMDFEAPSGGRVDLHWHALNLCCHSSADQMFWDQAQPLEFLGLPLRTCAPTAHLFGICVHGIVWSETPPLRWIADSILLLRRFPALDWELLIRASLSLDVVPYVRRALEFLRSEFDAPVPAEVLTRLSGAAVRASTAAGFARDSDPFAARSAWQDLLPFYARWRRSLGGAFPVWHAAGFVRHLEYAFECESAWALARYLTRSAFGRLAGRRP